MTFEERKNNLVLLKSMEKADKELRENFSEQIISDPLLDKKLLVSLLGDSLMGTLVNKNTGEKITLDNKTMMLGFQNLINRYEK